MAVQSKFKTEREDNVVHSEQQELGLLHSSRRSGPRPAVEAELRRLLSGSQTGASGGGRPEQTISMAGPGAVSGQFE